MRDFISTVYLRSTTLTAEGYGINRCTAIGPVDHFGPRLRRSPHFP